jgi:hypothetical protein
MSSDVEYARNVRSWIDGPHTEEHVLTAAVNGHLIDELTWAFPGAAKRFGLAALQAAPKSGAPCRWCLARLYSTVHGLPRPSLGRATRALLGQDPCPKCVKAARDEAAARVDKARKTPSRSVKSTARSEAVSLHPLGTCVTCHSFRASARSALTAGTTVPAVPAQHRPILGALGRVGLVPPKVYGHDVEGVICNCQQCKAKRVRGRGGRR